MPEKIQQLLDLVEEVIDNGDWPTENAEGVLQLINDIRDGELYA